MIIWTQHTGDSMNEPPALHLGLSPLVTLFDFLALESIYLLPAEDKDPAVDEDENVKFWPIGSKK